MTFTVNKSNGDVASVISDYRKEIVAGLSLLGHGYPNYGEDIARDLVILVENFAKSSSPYNPLIGQLWLDTSSSPYYLKICTARATALDTVGFTSTGDGSSWTKLFGIDATNGLSGITYNSGVVYPDVAATPNTLVVRGPGGKIDPASLPSIGLVSNASHANTADFATTAGQLSSAKVFGSRRGPNSISNQPNSVGYPFDGTNDCFITTDYVAEGQDATFGKYFTESRVRAALSGGRYISVDTNSGQISFNGPDPTSGSQGSQGPQGIQGPKGDTGSQGPTGPAGTNGTPQQVVTQSNFGTTGYVVYAGGFCIQWGQYRATATSEYSVNQNFPLSFDNAPLSVTVTPYLDYFTVSANLWAQVVGSGSSTGFTVGYQAATSNDNRIDGFNWMAFGTVGLGSSSSTTQTSNVSSTPSTNSGSTSVNTSGDDSGGGGCVWVNSVMPSGKLAGDIVVGDDLLILNRDGSDGYHHEGVEKIRRATQPCYRISTESGITLVASDSTPITTRNDTVVWLLDSMGLEVPVLDQGTFRWEKIVSLDPMGDLDVVLITAGNGTYAAGEKLDNRFIFTHNATGNNVNKN